ncbi:hypothetical protein ACJX0J_031720, partial [Zea mays]
SFSCCCLSLILYDVQVNKLIKKVESEVTDGSQLATTIPYFCNYSVHVEDKNFIEDDDDGDDGSILVWSVRDNGDCAAAEIQDLLKQVDAQPVNVKDVHLRTTNANRTILIYLLLFCLKKMTMSPIDLENILKEKL